MLLSSVVLALLFWQWRTMPAAVWHVGWQPGRVALWTAFAAGWVTVLLSTFMINHFDLFGLRQVYLASRGTPYTRLGFRTSMLYRAVRHPIMAGFIVAFWATPDMTAGHLLFAVATTAYILFAIQLEEHDLVADLGDQYRGYRDRVPMIVPGLHRHAGPTRGNPGFPGTLPRPV